MRLRQALSGWFEDLHPVHTNTNDPLGGVQRVACRDQVVGPTEKTSWARKYTLDILRCCAGCRAFKLGVLRTLGAVAPQQAQALHVLLQKRSEAVDGALIKVVTPNGDTARESLFWCAVEKEDVQCLSDVYEVEAKRDLPWPKA